MGKFMGKAKLAGDVAVMDVSLGVRTRAKTLALQRHHSTAAAGAVAAPVLDDGSCYLELRSRRLEKQLQKRNSRRTRRGCGCKGKERSEAGGFCGVVDLVSCSIEIVEASFGENISGSKPGPGESRNSRDSTRCSSTRDSHAHGSTPKRARSSGSRDELVSIPTQLELEEFFAREELSLQNLFKEKYNFNFAMESPLPGRYEWVKLSPS